ncbi:MAG: acyl-CoA dehydratase activase [Geobacteraceae bacterium]|nr:acyl-CoA dehydratase activase [Geobacteraceae bacterium]
MRIGIDLGSRKVKFAMVSAGSVVRLETFDTISFYRNFGRMKGDDLTFDLAATGLFSAAEIAESGIVATGYGRNTLHLKGVRVISEIRAHTAGALFQTGLRDFTLLDMGGQDTKVALIRDGSLKDFVMNDKCAASSGRYLENMAAVLEVGLDELSSHWENPVRLDATCGIFGESELIGQIVRGYPVARLCAGVNRTLVKRVVPMLRRFPSGQIVLTGGVARNGALVRLLEEEGYSVTVPENPQHNGAIGCAVIAG